MHLDDLVSVLRAHCRPGTGGSFSERETRAHARLVAICESLADAHRVHYDPEWTIADLDYLTSSRAAMTSLAEQYVGLPSEVSFESAGLSGGSR